MFSPKRSAAIRQRARLPMIYQNEGAECGIACLAMISTYHGKCVDIGSLRQKYAVSQKGLKARSLVEIAAHLGFSARPVRCELEDLRHLDLPCILHWEFRHFVVLSSVDRSGALIHDPRQGIRRVAHAELSRGFTGVAIEFRPSPGFEKAQARARLRLSDLVRWSPSLRSGVTKVLLMSIALELFALLSPLYLRTIIDRGVPDRNVSLCVGVGAAFALATVLGALVTAFRDYAIQYCTASITYDSQIRLFRHLIKLPLEFFQRRSAGDILQKFRGIDQIKTMVVSGSVSAVLDGTLALATCWLMMAYNFPLGVVMVAACVAYVAARVAILPLSQRRLADALVADAKEQGRFLETIRGIQTIKSMAGETIRSSIWHNAFAERIHTSVRAANIQILMQCVAACIMAVSDVLTILIASLEAINGHITIGAVTLFIAYKKQFADRVVALVDQAVAFRLLGVQLERTSDIALELREAGIDNNQAGSRPIKGGLALRAVEYSYSAFEEPVLKNIDLEIAPGEMIAITGASGAGKSTLIRLLSGLCRPTAGELLVDGYRIDEIGPINLRRQIGIVMQEEQLMSGTIAENIAFFSENADPDRVQSAAKGAGIHEDIMAFPMQYNSLIGEMGSLLSSGQKQRILFARAIYKRPKIIILDEGTAHLDPVTEQKVLATLKNLPATRIIVAHSERVAAIADRRLELADGHLRPVTCRLPNQVA